MRKSSSGWTPISWNVVNKKKSKSVEKIQQQNVNNEQNSKV